MTQAEEPSAPWIHIGECPLCVNGLCRLRYCEDDHGAAHLFAMCDECEAIWLEPSTSAPAQFPDACEPLCPLCARPLYGPQAHWARSEEVLDLNWNEAAIFDLPSMEIGPNLDNSSPQSEEQGLVTPEDTVDALDAPPAATAHREIRDTTSEPLHKREVVGYDELDEAYGQDDPKPGC